MVHVLTLSTGAKTSTCPTNCRWKAAGEEDLLTVSSHRPLMLASTRQNAGFQTEYQAKL